MTGDWAQRTGRTETNGISSTSRQKIFKTAILAKKKKDSYFSCTTVPVLTHTGGAVSFLQYGHKTYSVKGEYYKNRQNKFCNFESNQIKM